MGELTPGSMMIGLQYCSAMLESSQSELELLQQVLNSMLSMERAKMLKVSTDPQVEAFKAYKGAIAKLANFRQLTMKKRNSAALRAGKRL